MNIFINAYNLKIGGGESIGLGFIDALHKINTNDTFHLLIPKNESYQRFKPSKNIHIHYCPVFFADYLIGRLLCVFYLVYLVKKLNPDAIFSMGNYAIPVRKKQLVLLHWPYVVYPESRAWKQMPLLDFVKRKIRCLMVRQKLRFASVLTVQTELMKTRVLQHLNFKEETIVVKSASSLKIPSSESKKALELIKATRKQYLQHRFLLFVSVYYSHKNIEVLIPLAKQIKHKHDPFKLFISLDPFQNKKTTQLLQRIKKEGLDDIIINLGKIPRGDLLEIYKSSDAFIMPTLLESYGITYMEAMIAGIPIFTSDLDFAHETCGEAAFYFNPLDFNSIYNTIIQAYQSPSKIANKIALGKRKTEHFLSWEEITQKYLDILKNI